MEQLKMKHTQLMKSIITLHNFISGQNVNYNDAKVHTYIIGHYNPSVRIIDLVSHTTYVVCLNFYTQVAGPTV